MCEWKKRPKKSAPQMVVVKNADDLPWDRIRTNLEQIQDLQIVQGGPLPVISGVISPINGLING